jgi:hypothetical protein
VQPTIPVPLFAIALLVGMLLLVELGRRLGTRRLSQETQAGRGDLGGIEAAVFGLFSLLIAFTFGGAAERFGEKRMLIAEEANDIGTAYLRLDLVPQDKQPALRELFRKYLDSRLDTYRKLPDMVAAREEMAKSKSLQNEIWSNAVLATRLPESHSAAGMLLLPALNNMIDIATTRTMALQNHPPGIIFALLFALGLICSLLAGYRMANDPRRSWLHILGFTLFTVIIVNVILDIEYPRIGSIRLGNYDQVLVDLRDSMR